MALSLKLKIRLLILIPLLGTLGILWITAFFLIREIQFERKVSQNLNHMRAIIQEDLISQLQLSINRIHNVNFDLEDFSQLERYFWYIVKSEPNLRAIYYGNKQSKFIGVQKLNNNQIIFLLKEQPQALRKTYLLNEKGQKIRSFGQPDNYVPQERPWYQVAVKAGDSAWTNIFRFKAQETLGMAASMPIYSPRPLQQNSQSLLGVLSIDFFLSDINKIVQNISREFQKNPSFNQATFFLIGACEQSEKICENPKKLEYLVASSTAEKTSFDRLKKPLLARESLNPIIRAADRKIQENKQENLENPQNLSLLPITHFHFKTEEGVRYRGEMSSLSRNFGANLALVIILPESAFSLTNLLENIDIFPLIMLVSLGVVIPVTAIGLLASRRMIKCISTITEVGEAIKNDRFETDSLETIKQRQDELGTLAQVIQEMAAEVYQREQAIAQKLKNFKRETNQRKKASLLLQMSEQKYLEELLKKAKTIRHKD